MEYIYKGTILGQIVYPNMTNVYVCINPLFEFEK